MTNLNKPMPRIRYQCGHQFAVNVDPDYLRLAQVHAAQVDCPDCSTARRAVGDGITDDTAAIQVIVDATAARKREANQRRALDWRESNGS